MLSLDLLRGIALPLLLRHEHSVNVRQYTSRRNRDASEQFVELLVLPRRKLDMARDHTRLLVVARGDAGQHKAPWTQIHPFG